MGLLKWFHRFLKRGDLPIDIGKVERALQYHFSNPAYLYKSLKHRSYSQAVDGSTRLSNERLEFLGDSVLNMVVSHHVFLDNPDSREGDLTRLRSSYVNKMSATIAARKIGLDKFVLLNESEESAGGRNRTSIIGDTFEAVIGAVYLDGGYEAARAFVHRTILSDGVVCHDVEQSNHKSRLLETTQARKLGHPSYRTVSESGPDHDKVFTVEVYLNGTSIGVGSGKNKKAAQQMAAKEGLGYIGRLPARGDGASGEEKSKP